MRRAIGTRSWLALIAGIVAVAILLASGWDAATQAPPSGPLAAAAPAPNEFSTTTLDRISLIFAAPIDPESAHVRLLGTGGAEIPLRPAQVTADVPTDVVAPLTTTLAPGDYTVVWSARAADGAPLAGAYPFRAGVSRVPGAAQLAGEWPAPWATVLRWLVFLGTAVAAGGFAWARLMTPRATARAPGGFWRMGVMALSALLALLATVLTPLVARFIASPRGTVPLLAETVRAMPVGWWLQLAALFVLTLLCLGALASGRAAVGLPAALAWIGLGTGLAALAGLSLQSHAATPPDRAALGLEIAHQWSTALWLSGVLYLAAGWRELGSDVARFRTVRWIGGVLVAVSVVTGLLASWRLFPGIASLLTSQYGQVLIVKGAIVLAVVALGVLAMAVPRRSNAARASRSLGAQTALALLAALLSAFLALLAAPGTIAPASLAGVALADVVPVDRAAFTVPSATIHLLTQPVAPGTQTLVVRLTDGAGAPLAGDPPPAVEVFWTPFAGAGDAARQPVAALLQPDPSDALFTGAATLPEQGWWQVDVVVTPPGGIAAWARFWLVLPDPNVTGTSPEPESDAEARALYERGLESLTSLRSVRFTQRLGDGSGSLYRSQTALRAAEGEQPAAYAETIVDASGNIAARQTIVGDRRWIQVGEADWAPAAPISFLIPTAWSESYADATGFHLGPRETIDGELSQVVTFWQPGRQDPARAPAWFAWWVGLASGEVRREVMISTRHYMVNSFSDFDAPLDIAPPVVSPGPAATPGQEATPVATAAAGEAAPP